MIYEVRVMVIIEVKSNKKMYMDLLFLADEQEDMINCYLERGTMYILDDNGVKAECVVTEEPNGILEIKNLAVRPNHQRKGYGKKLIDFLVEQYSVRQKKLCKSRDTAVKGTGANQGLALAGHRLA